MKKFNSETESRVYGRNVCRAIFKTRPKDIITFFLTKNISSEFREELSFLAKEKKSYHIVNRDELESMTKSTHHEDVCLVIKKKPALTFDQYLKDNKNHELIVALENVSNPHNIGAIIRSMAHFDIRTLLVPKNSKLDSGALFRTSEGGAEYVQIIEVEKFHDALAILVKNKFDILATSSHRGDQLYEYKFNKKTVLLFGEEGPGLSKEALKKFKTIQINGTGNVESLNVSVATSIIVAEYFRQTKLK